MAAADSEYEKKLAEMRQYLPFLDTMIQRLDNKEGPSRENQRNKLKSLRSWLKNGNKRLKLENLLRCEEVLLRLFSKVKKQPEQKQFYLNEMLKHTTQSPTDKNKTVNLEKESLKIVEQPSTSKQQSSTLDNETVHPAMVISEFKKSLMIPESVVNKPDYSPVKVCSLSDSSPKRTKELAGVGKNISPKTVTQNYQENSISNQPMNFYKETDAKGFCIEKTDSKKSHRENSRQKLDKFCESDPFNNFDLNAPSSSSLPKSETLQLRKEFTRVLRSPESNVSYSRTNNETPKKKSSDMRPPGEASHYRRSPKSSRKSPSYSPKLKHKKDHKSHIRSPKGKSSHETKDKYSRSPCQREYRESSKKSKSDSKKPHDSRKSKSSIFSRLGSKIEGKTQSFDKIMKLVNNSKDPLEDLQRIRDKLYRDLYLEVQCDMIESPEDKFDSNDVPVCADKEDGEIVDGEEDTDLIYKNMFLETDENSVDNTNKSSSSQESKWSPNKARKVVKEIIKINMLTSQPSNNVTRPNVSINSEEKAKGIAGLLDSILTSVNKKLGFENQESYSPCSTFETIVNSPVSLANPTKINFKICDSRAINICNSVNVFEVSNKSDIDSDDIVENNPTKKNDNELNNIKNSVKQLSSQADIVPVHGENNASISNINKHSNSSRAKSETVEINKKVCYANQITEASKEKVKSMTGEINTSNKCKQQDETIDEKPENTSNPAKHIMKLASSTIMKQDKCQPKPSNTSMDTKNVEEDILSALNKETQGVVLDDKNIQDLILGEKRDTSIDCKQRDMKNANTDKSDSRTRRISFQKYKETAGIVSRGLTLKELKRFNLKPNLEEKEPLTNFQIPGLCEGENVEPQVVINSVNCTVTKSVNSKSNESAETSKDTAYNTSNINELGLQIVGLSPVSQNSSHKPVVTSTSKPVVTSTPKPHLLKKVPLLSSPTVMSPSLQQTMQMCFVQAIKNISESAKNVNGLSNLNSQTYGPQIPTYQNMYPTNQTMQSMGLPNDIFNQVQSSRQFQGSSYDTHNNDESVRQSHYPQFIDDRNNHHPQQSFNFNANFPIRANYRVQSPKPMLNYNTHSRLSDPRRNSVSRESISRESVGRDCVRRDSVNRDNGNRDSVNRDSVNRDSVMRDSIVRDIACINNPDNYQSRNSMNFGKDRSIQNTDRRLSIDSFSSYSPAQTDSYLFSPVYNQKNSGYLNDFNKRPDSNIRPCNNFSDKLNALSSYPNIPSEYDHIEYSRKAESNLKRFNYLSNRVKPVSYRESSVGRTYMGEPLSNRRFERAKSVGRILETDRLDIESNFNKFTFNRMSRAPSVGRLTSYESSLNQNWVDDRNLGTSKYPKHFDRFSDFYTNDSSNHIQNRNVSNTRPTFKRAQSVGRFSDRSNFTDRFPPKDISSQYSKNNVSMKNNQNLKKNNESIFNRLDCKDFEERSSVNIARNYDNLHRTSYGRDLHTKQLNVPDVKRKSVSRDPRLQPQAPSQNRDTQATTTNCLSERGRNRDRKSISERGIRRESGHSRETDNVCGRTQSKNRNKSSNMMNYSKSELIKNIERNKSSIRNFKIPKIKRTFNENTEKADSSSQKIPTNQLSSSKIISHSKDTSCRHSTIKISKKSSEANKEYQKEKMNKNESNTKRKERFETKQVKKETNSKSNNVSGSDSVNNKMKNTDLNSSQKKSSISNYESTAKVKVISNSDEKLKLRSVKDNVNRQNKRVSVSSTSDEKLTNNKLKNNPQDKMKNIKNQYNKTVCEENDTLKEFVNKENFKDSNFEASNNDANIINAQKERHAKIAIKDKQILATKEMPKIEKLESENCPTKMDTIQLSNEIQKTLIVTEKNNSDSLNKKIQTLDPNSLEDKTELCCVEQDLKCNDSGNVSKKEVQLNYLADGFWIDMDISDKNTERKLSPFEIITSIPKTTSTEDLNQIDNDILRVGSDVSDSIKQKNDIYCDGTSSSVSKVSSSNCKESIVDVKHNNCISQKSSSEQCLNVGSVPSLDEICISQKPLENCLNIGNAHNLEENKNSSNEIIAPNNSLIDVCIQIDGKSNHSDGNTYEVVPKVIDTELNISKDICSSGKNTENETFVNLKESESLNDIPKQNEVSNLLSILNDKSKILEMLNLLEQTDESDKLRKKLQKLADIESDDESDQNLVVGFSDNKVIENVKSDDCSLILPSQEKENSSQLIHIVQEIDSKPPENNVSNITTSETINSIVEQSKIQKPIKRSKFSRKGKFLRKNIVKKEHLKKKVSSQIKTRSFSKTVKSIESPVKKKPKVSRELLALQEDIREMFISKGVLNLNPSGIRMCRVAKDTRLQEFMSNVEVAENKTESNENTVCERITRKRVDSTNNVDSSENEPQKEAIKIAKQSRSKPDAVLKIIKNNLKKQLRTKKQKSSRNHVEEDSESKKELYGKIPCIILKKDDVLTKNNSVDEMSEVRNSDCYDFESDDTSVSKNNMPKKKFRKKKVKVVQLAKLKKARAPKSKSKKELEILQLPIITLVKEKSIGIQKNEDDIDDDLLTKVKPGPKSKKKMLLAKSKLSSDDLPIPLESQSFKSDLGNNTKDSIQAATPESSSEDESLISFASVNSLDLGNRPKGKKKKKSQWSSGVIKRKKKIMKCIEMLDSEFFEENTNVPCDNISGENLSNEFFTDKSYYFDINKISYECKLCSYNGLEIVNHHKLNHPHCEFTMARLETTTAEEAIGQSLEIISADCNANDNAKTSFQCRFCKRTFKKFTVQRFYEHILRSHTGEYIEPCNICHKSNNIDNKHCKFSSNVIRATPPNDSNSILMGYICTICNYTQLHEGNIMKHIDIRHNQTSKALQINLCMLPLSDTISENISICDNTENVNNDNNSNQSHSTNDNNSANVSKVSEIISSFNNARSVSVTDCIQSKIDATAAVAEESALRNTQGPNVNEEWLDEECEIQRPKSCAFALNTEPNQNSSVRVKQEPGVNNISTNIPLLNTERKLAKGYPVHVSDMRVRIRDDDLIEYTCFIQDCARTFQSLSDLAKHLNNLHLTHKWNGICTECRKNVRENDGQYTTMETLEHIVSVHMENNETLLLELKSSKEPTSTPKKPLIQLRPIADLMFRVLEPDNVQVNSSPSVETSMNVEINPSVKVNVNTNIHADENMAINIEDNTNIDNVQITDDDLSCVRIENVISLSNMDPPSITSPENKQIVVIRKRNVSSAKIAASNEITQPVLQESGSEIPVELNLNKSAVRLISKPINLFEKLLSNHKQRHLFKCASDNCTYSTDLNENFLEHLKNHSSLTHEDLGYPCCIYCHFSDSNPQSLITHMISVHGHCCYICKYCIFRAASPIQVKVHQEIQHKDMNINILRIAPHPQSKKPVSTTTYEVSNFICKQGDCDKPFITRNTFLEHLTKEHSTCTKYACHICNVMCLRPIFLVSHYKNHLFCLYQCIYCKYGSETENEMTHHMMEVHPWQLPQACVRYIISSKTKLINPSVPIIELDKQNMSMHVTNLDDLGEGNSTIEEDPLHTVIDQSLRLIPLSSDTASLVAYQNEKCVVNRILEVRPMTSKKSCADNISVVSQVIYANDEGKTQTTTINETSLLSNVSTPSQVSSSSADVKVLQANKQLGPLEYSSKSTASAKKALPKKALLKKVLPKKSSPKKTSPKKNTTLTELLSLPKIAPKPKAVPNNATSQATLVYIPKSSMAINVSPAGDILIDADVKSLLLEVEQATATLSEINRLESNKADETEEGNREGVKSQELENGSNENVIVLDSDDENSPMVSLVEKTKKKRGIPSGDPVAIISLSDDDSENPAANTTPTDLLVPTENSIPFDLKESIPDSPKKKLKLDGYDLYRCGSSTCGVRCPTMVSFKEHVANCVSSERITCFHCKKIFRKNVGLFMHLPTHGKERWKCGLCECKKDRKANIVTHLKQVHKSANYVIVPLDKSKANESEDIFILKPISCPPAENASTKNQKEIKNYKIAPKPLETSKKTYSPDEISLLPLTPVWENELCCSRCSFKTKVRSNMVRHLMLHAVEISVPSAAPVNPVPHLETNEKHFDKMSNLALSSNMDRSSDVVSNKDRNEIRSSPSDKDKYPKYIPTKARYVCGATGCSYISVDESMLKYHWEALHSTESNYKCAHCPPNQQMNHERALTASRIVSHLKMHDSRLYNCIHCNYYHFQKHLVERHLMDKHPNLARKVGIVREMEESSEASASEESVRSVPTMDLKPWQCGLCPYKTMLKEDIMQHCDRIHNIKSQFKCSLCTFVTSIKQAIENHVEAHHEDQTREITIVYYKDDPQLNLQSQDNHPLWWKQRKRPSQFNEENITMISASDFSVPIASKKIKMTNERIPQLSSNKVKAPIKTSIAAKLNRMFEAEKSTKDCTDQIKIVNVKSEAVDTETIGLEYPEIVSCHSMAIPSDQATSIEDGQRQFRCTLCSSSFTGLTAFKEHLYEEFDYPRWSCSSCSAQLFNEIQAQEHATQKHKNASFNITKLPFKSEKESLVDSIIASTELDGLTGEPGLDGLAGVESTEPESILPDVTETDSPDLERLFGSYSEPNGLKYKCPIVSCEYQTVYRLAMESHLIQEVKCERWRCTTCSKKFIDDISAKNHSQQAHKPATAQIETLIGNSFKTNHSWKWIQNVLNRQHAMMPKADDVPTMSTMRADNVELLNAGKRSASDEIIKPAPKKMRGKSGLYGCDVCPFTTLLKPSFSKHKIKHQDRLYSCKYCRSFTGAELTDIEAHCRIKHENKPVCYITTDKDTIKINNSNVFCFLCQVIIKRSNVVNHIEQFHHETSVHITNKNNIVFVCIECGSVLSDFVMVVRHFGDKHRNSNLQIKINKMEAVGVMFRCDLCPQLSYKYRFDLDLHRDQEHTTYYNSIDVLKVQNAGVDYCSAAGKSASHILSPDWKEEINYYLLWGDSSHQLSYNIVDVTVNFANEC